jgi:uncharacterized repeat protein (TIGR02059 family)
MRKVLTVFLCLISIIASATDYYVSSSGSDSANGLSSSTSWQTISKVNAVFSGLNPGDRILFKRGDVFTGALRISRSGLSGSPITIGAYGTGANPIINGFTTITGWNNYGNGIYSKSISCESKPNMVTVNGINTPIGRWPNSEFLSIDSHISNTSITDAALPSSPNWTGAEVIIRKNSYIWDRNTITEHSGSTLNYKSGSYYESSDGFGYFIQNDIKTLDKLGEWYYDGSTFYMYFGTTSPVNYEVKVSSIDQLVNLLDKNYITIDNISFEGANVYAVQISNSNSITVKNCSINFTGGNAIYGPWNGTSLNCVITNNTITNSNNSAIKLSGDHKNATITNNTVTNSGTIVGMGGCGDETYVGVGLYGDNSLAQYNSVKNSGYMGIQFGGDNTVISNNLVDNFNLLKNDGGGIYTYAASGDVMKGRKITNNVVLNGKGYEEGLPVKETFAHGIYLDGPVKNITVENNSVGHCTLSGIYVHNSHEVTINSNTLFNNGSGDDNIGSQLLFIHDSYSPNDPIRNVTMNNNIFFARTESQLLFAFSTTGNDISRFGTSDYNCYAKPINNTYIAKTWDAGWYSTAVYHSLANWQSFSEQDKNSYISPVAISDVNKIRFEYNASNSNKVIALDGSYTDVKGIKYSGNLTLLPYTSAVLMIDPNPSVPPAIPVYVSSVIENATPSVIQMTYNLSLANIVPAVSAFSVNVNSAARNVSSVTVSGTKVLLTLVSPVAYGNSVTVAYTKPSVNPLQTSSGGQAASINAQTVTNKVNAVSQPVVIVTPPAVVNTPPVVVVNNISGTYSGFVGKINASGSYDANKDNLTYAWKVPGNIPVSATNSPVIEFLAPIVDVNQTFEFALTVSDGKNPQTKTVPVTIIPYEPGLEKAEIISVEAASFQSPYYPYNILDGNIGTMWSVNGNDQWIILELNGTYSIQHIKLAFQPGQKKEFYFDIFGSNDKENWEPVLSKSRSCSFSGNLQVFDFPASKTEREFRYVKLVGQGNSVDKWNYLSEFRIFGYRHKNPADYEEQIVKIYPNPAHELVNILIDEPTFMPDFIKIANLTGMVIYDDKVDPYTRQFQIPIDFKQGIYIVQMGIGDITTFTQKIIVTN